MECRWIGDMERVCGSPGGLPYCRNQRIRVGASQSQWQCLNHFDEPRMLFVRFRNRNEFVWNWQLLCRRRKWWWNFQCQFTLRQL